jgi:hypothetical protein
MSTGTDPDSDELTLANVKDGTIKYKTLRKDRLQLLCGTLLDHIEDYEAKFVGAYVKEAKAKAEAIGKIDQIITVQRAEIEELKEAVLVSNASNVELRAELKEAKVEKAKVELESEGDVVFFVDNGTGHRDRVPAHVAPRAVRTALAPDGAIAILGDAVGGELELELKEAIPTGDDSNSTGTTTSIGEEGEEDVMGVEEGDVNVKVNATSNEAKSSRLAKLVKLAKSTNMWCLSPHVPLSQEARDKDKQRQRKVCPVNLRGEVCTADNCGSKHPEVCLVANHGKGKIPKATCTLWHMRIPRGNSVGNSDNNNNKDKYIIRLEAECRAEELKARIRATKMMSQGITYSQMVEGPPHRDRVPAHVAPRAVRTALTPDGAIAILEDAVERLRLLLP